MNTESARAVEGWKSVSDIFKDDSHNLWKHMYYWEGYDLSSNIYLIKTDEMVALIDPGNDYSAFYELFAGGLCGPADIRKVLLTHGHHEHVMGVFELLRGYPTLRSEGHLDIYIHEACPKAFREIAENLGCAVHFIKNEDLIEIGSYTFKVIHTPGHTMDSVCYIHEETKSLFSGDTVLPFAVASPDPIAGGRIDFHMFSMRILRESGIKNLFPGHGEIIKDEASKVLDGNYAGLIKKVIGLQCPWIEGAQFLLQKGYLQETVFCCEKVLEDDPKNKAALYLKACCLNDMGKFEDALAAFKEIDEKGVSNNPLYYVGYGCSLMGLGRYKESLEYFDKAIQIAPDLENAWVYKGLALYLQGDIDKAFDIKEFEQAFTGKLKEELLKTYGEKEKE